MTAVESVEVTWSPVVTLADDVLVARVGALLGRGTVETGRLCPTCASDLHGRPWARYDGHDVPVSVSRSGGHLVTAMAPGVLAVGVDVEGIAAFGQTAPNEVLAPGESADDVAGLARIWVAKEAILKAYGTGLTTPMTALRVADFHGRLDVVEAPPGFVAAVASVERR